MSSPVTRAELREELAKYPTKAELREELANYPTKAELREELARALANYPTKAELREELARELAEYPTKAELREELDRLRRKLSLELAHHVKSFEEFTRSMIVALDDRYRDLPARVTRLEAQVFAPKRKRR